MVRLPKSFSNTLSFKPDLRSGASALEAELMGEKAYALGRAEAHMKTSLADLKVFKGSDASRQIMLQKAANAVHAYFIQRELVGFIDHKGPAEDYNIPKEVLIKVGVKE